MTTQDTALWALAGCAVFLLLAFGLRSVMQYRRTGSTGFIGVSGHPGSAEWCGGMLFVLAVVAAVAAPILQLAGAVTPHPAFASATARSAGVVLYSLGVAGTLWAQFAMGDSWRIGVDTTARTTLVASGPFRWVRNPIFTAMSAATLGLALLVPNLVSLVTVIALIAALEIQVRLVEEPYLARMHGDDYRRYAAATGRFLPGIGRFWRAENGPEGVRGRRGPRGRLFSGH
jgi:protein-S-isoprenylcysteine O-methyltransferase Ste14